jgi:FixJ family two-component response regulator
MRESIRGLIRSAEIERGTFSSTRFSGGKKCPRVPARLVLNVRMPGLSGLDLQNELADAKRQIPIIFVTAACR